MSAALLALVETLERQRREVIELYVAVLNQEPGVEADRDRGADEVGCVEGSAAHVPSDRAENKPRATAVIAGAPIPIKRDPSPLRPLCQRPEICGGYGSNHCHACRQAAGETHSLEQVA